MQHRLLHILSVMAAVLEQALGTGLTTQDLPSPMAAHKARGFRG
jgi:hypothetical protein